MRIRTALRRRPAAQNEMQPLTGRSSFARAGRSLSDYSLEGNGIGAKGALALADALKHCRELRDVRYAGQTPTQCRSGAARQCCRFNRHAGRHFDGPGRRIAFKITR